LLLLCFGRRIALGLPGGEPTRKLPRDVSFGKVDKKDNVYDLGCGDGEALVLRRKNLEPKEWA